MVLLVGIHVVGLVAVTLKCRHGPEEVDAGIEHPDARLLWAAAFSSMSRMRCQLPMRSLSALVNIRLWRRSTAAFRISA
jgi:hypothetical protein